MEPNPISEELALNEAFGIILSKDLFADHVVDIAELIYNDKLSRQTLNNILNEYGFGSLRDIKQDLLDLVISYIDLILDDHILTDTEHNNIKRLKLYFDINEGDFYKYRKTAIGAILGKEFWRMYQNNKIDSAEAMQNAGLQELFDLSHDQFDGFKETVVREALERGADITDLDTAKFPKGYFRY